MFFIETETIPYSTIYSEFLIKSIYFRLKDLQITLKKADNNSKI